MATDDPSELQALHDAIVEASHLIDMAVNAALSIAGADHYRWHLQAIAVEAEELRSGISLNSTDESVGWLRYNGDNPG